MSELVLLSTRDHVTTLTLNDPDRRNGLSPEMIESLIAALSVVTADANARCLVITGTGNSFSAGGDPKRMVEPGLYDVLAPAELARFYRDGIQRLPLALYGVEIPIIAAVNGHAIGAGCDVAALCDLRIASEEARFASSFVKLGLVPGDGGAWILPRAVGMANAMEMMLTGAVIDARRALQMGLVSQVVPHDSLLDKAHELASQIAANPPVTVKLSKKLVRDCGSSNLFDALGLSASAQVLAQKSHDHQEAVHALLEKRKPVYVGR